LETSDGFQATRLGDHPERVMRCNQMIEEKGQNGAKCHEAQNGNLVEGSRKRIKWWNMIVGWNKGMAL
jgi:hypothetical protein